MNSIYNIGIAGNIGVGKTTLTERLSKDLQLEPIYESVIDNPYLLDFYTDMSRWSFNLQIYFLYTRFASQIDHLKMKLSEENNEIIFFNTELDEITTIFAKNNEQNKENVVDADFEEVKEDKNDKDKEKRA